MTRSTTSIAMLFAAALAVAAPLAAPASAQMRGNQPATLPPPPSRADPALLAIDRFRGAYRQAGSPRIVILWNREFSDELSSEYEDRVTRDATTSEEENQVDEETAGPAGTMATRDRNLLKREMSEDVAGTKRVRSKRAQLVSEPVQWQMEENFQATLRAGGADIVDRNAAMRRTGLALGADERANVQAIEMAALSQSADWLVEVLMAPDSRAPDGVGFRINVRDLRSDRLLANFATGGRPRAGPQPLVAGPGGFVRASAPEPGPSQVASQLAIELMENVAATGPR